MSSDSSSWQRPWWLSFLDRTNLTVTALTASAILLTRSAGVLYFGAGAVLCSFSVRFLKKAIRQPRPAGVRQTKKTYGMPSTHSATIAYYTTFVPLACMYLPVHPSLPTGWVSRVLPPIVVMPWASLIASSRVWLGHHTWIQVAAGCAYGVVFACIWFSLRTHGLNEHGRTVEELFNSYL
ncbi:hypothetical protein B0H10DRAFT_1983026 [Mycena sp. CBHHK59/15]|nr:hypothetical protein B0H10DRAFT_1983026 [Mycena sp. CBHHK59/15]